MTTAIGPVLGGWLVDHASWRAVFFINIPLAIVVIVISVRHVPETRSDKKNALDWLGAVLAAASLGALVFALIESARLGIAHRAVIASMLLGGLGLVAFFIVEWRSRHPMLPLELFRSRTFTGANLLTLFLYSALGGTFFFLPLNLIQVQSYSPTQAGAALLPFILIMFLLSRWSGGLVDRYGARLPLVLGPLIAAVGFALFTFPRVGGGYWTTFFPAVVVLGIGMAVSVAPLTTTVMNSVAGTRAGIASGVNNAVARTAGLLAIAVLGIVMLQSFDRALDIRTAQLDLPANVRMSLAKQRNRLAAAGVSDGEPEVRAMVKEAIARSFVDAFRQVMFVGAGLATASAITALAFIRSKKAADQAKVT
jgi:MFS family permease